MSTSQHAQAHSTRQLLPSGGERVTLREGTAAPRRVRPGVVSLAEACTRTGLARSAAALEAYLEQARPDALVMTGAGVGVDLHALAGVSAAPLLEVAVLEHGVI